MEPSVRHVHLIWFKTFSVSHAIQDTGNEITWLHANQFACFSIKSWLEITLYIVAPYSMNVETAMSELLAYTIIYAKKTPPPPWSARPINSKKIISLEEEFWVAQSSPRVRAPYIGMYSNWLTYTNLKMNSTTVSKNGIGWVKCKRQYCTISINSHITVNFGWQHQ